MEVTHNDTNATITVSKHELAVLDYALGFLLQAENINQTDRNKAHLLEEKLFAAFCAMPSPKTETLVTMTI